MTNIRAGILRAAMAAIAAAALIGGCVPSANGPADTFSQNYSLPPDSSTKGAIIFLVDGVNADVFADMLAKGELPNIKHYFVDRGLYIPRAVANVPTVTLCNLTSVVTAYSPAIMASQATTGSTATPSSIATTRRLPRRTSWTATTPPPPFTRIAATPPPSRSSTSPTRHDPLHRGLDLRRPTVLFPVVQLRRPPDPLPPWPGRRGCTHTSCLAGGDDGLPAIAGLPCV